MESASVALGHAHEEHHGPPEAHQSSRIDRQTLGILLFIVSEVELRPAPGDVGAHGEDRPRVTIERATGVKCERCWRYVPAVSTDPASAGLCERCQDALAEPVHG